MKITNYGKDVVMKVIYVTLALDVIAFFVNIPLIKILLLSLSFFLLLFTLYFFRDPSRVLPENLTDNSVISPADGKVVLIEDVENIYKDYFGDIKVKQLSIFLSPLNVHVNCYPVSGTLKYFNYVKGEYLVAFNHKASDKNERSELGVETAKGKKLIFKQIAGFVARRIVCDVKLNQSVKTGEKFGMIKFGSRVDLIFDRNTYIKVKPGDKVTAGMTVLAELT
ncbi:MAG: phosphatidylserine decarboxylase family protein [Ignavibacteriae bacterium]|nr:phosphatidylserine decarboxylase family protein [Ignavibacteriota bacterium]